jgi:isopenicillin-N epimerase
VGGTHPLTDLRAWMLDPEVVHANHGSFGGITRRTWQAATAARERVAANPMRFFQREWEAAHAHAVRAVADLVGARDRTLQLVPNATAGLDLALRVLPRHPGARIVRTDHAYPSVVAALDDLAARAGARVVVAEVPHEATDAEATTAVLAAAEGADGVVLDHVASATARWFAVEDLVPRLRGAGTTVVVDAAHAPGHVAVDVSALGADAWVGNLHKWAAAPPALAAVVLDPRHHASVGPLLHSAASDDLPFPDGSAWAGTHDPGPLLVADQVVEQAQGVLHGLGESIEARAAAGAARVADRVGGTLLPGRGWMRAVALPSGAGSGPGRARALQAGVAARGVEVKVTAHRGRLLLRLSAHAYTTATDHERLADALAASLAR